MESLILGIFAVVFLVSVAWAIRVLRTPNLEQKTRVRGSAREAFPKAPKYVLR
jgi:hypothetical protein